MRRFLTTTAVAGMALATTLFGNGTPVATGERMLKERVAAGAAVAALVKLAERSAAALVVASIVAAAGMFSVGTANAAGRSYVGCGQSYSHCLSLRRAYVKEGVRIGPLHFGELGCTAPGCSNENWFYVYR